MIRVRLAALLLRTTGAKVQYSVRRTFNAGIAKSAGFRTLGTFDSLKDALTKYKKVRVADTDTITINVLATVAQRHGTLESKENTNA